MIFDENLFRQSIVRIFDENGKGYMLDGEKIEKFLRLTDIMLTENEKYNLTAIKEPDKIILNHYLDCAYLAEKLDSGASVADVGCGAGFPTLPIAIFRPDLRILGIDSTAKRTNYVAMAARELSLGNVKTLTARAEDAGKAADLREKFDYAVARAVAAMPVLCELCIPLVKPGGKFIAMKGKNALAELEEARRAIPTLGGRLLGVEEVTLRLDGEEASHPLIQIDKASKTPVSYPRPYAKILKNPL